MEGRITMKEGIYMLLSEKNKDDYDFVGNVSIVKINDYTSSVFLLE